MYPMPKIRVIQNRLIHHFGSGLLYSVMSPSHMWLVSSGLGSPGRRLAVHHSSHAQPTMLRTTMAMTYHDHAALIVRSPRCLPRACLHPAAVAPPPRNPDGGADSMPRPIRPGTRPAGLQ